MAYSANEGEWRDLLIFHRDFGQAPELFRHLPPTGRPTDEPDCTHLEPEEQSKIAEWVSRIDLNEKPPIPKFKTGTTSEELGEDANSKIVDYLEWFETPAYHAWRMNNLLQRWGQWQWMCADSLYRSKDVLAISADPAGAGSGAYDASAGTPHV